MRLRLSSLRGGFPDSIPEKAKVICHSGGLAKVETESGEAHWIHGVSLDASYGLIHYKMLLGQWVFEEDTNEN